MAQISTDMFFYNKVEKCFSQELSTLSGGRQNKEVFHRLYADACDDGLQLISHKTANVCTFYINRTHRQSGDITHWELLATPESVRKLPHMDKVKIIIWNT